MPISVHDIANICWENRTTICFGRCQQMPANTFQKNWFNSNGHYWIAGNNRPGWYWFEVDLSIAQLKSTVRPTNLTRGGCDIGETAGVNDAVFGRDLCQAKSGLEVIYNGQEANVLSRIRSHFAVSNQKTGALGINKYLALHGQQWKVSFFVESHFHKLTNLTPAQVNKIQAVIQSKTGRICVEQAWRYIYGWPALCKA